MSASIEGSVREYHANRMRAQRVWTKVWPGVAATGIVLVAWQALWLTGWRPHWVLPDPGTVAGELGRMLFDTRFWQALGTTMSRGAVGFVAALAVGTVLGALIARSTLLRSAIGSLLMGLQTMPSIAWFPLAILFFGATEQAILFVIVLGAAPSIANGLIAGIDDVPPQLQRAGLALGARGFTMFWKVTLPSAMPTYLAGLKQGWAFAWRSLMAGELLVVIAERASLGAQLSNARAFADAPLLIATMVVILVIGMLVDVAFSRLANGLRARRGLGMVRL